MYITRYRKEEKFKSNFSCGRKKRKTLMYVEFYSFEKYIFDT